MPFESVAGCAWRDSLLVPYCGEDDLKITEPENEPSRRVIEANGGVFVEHFVEPEPYGGGAAVRYRIVIA